MARNDQLRAAIKAADLTIGAFAEQLAVDRKTAERWVNGRTTPHGANRERIARVLRTPASHLWPDEVEVPAASAEPSPTPEVEAIWPTRSAVPASLWAELVDVAVESVDIAAYAAGWLFDADSGFADRLAAASARGARVRVALSQRKSVRALARGRAEGIGAGVRHLAAMSWTYLDRIAGSGVELRDHDLDLTATIFRADDRLLWSPHHAGLNDRDSPVLVVRLGDGGTVGSNALASLDWIWDHAALRTAGDD